MKLRTCDMPMILEPAGVYPPVKPGFTTPHRNLPPTEGYKLTWDMRGVSLGELPSAKRRAALDLYEKITGLIVRRLEGGDLLEAYVTRSRAPYLPCADYLRVL